MAENDSSPEYPSRLNVDTDFCRRLARISASGWPANETTWRGQWLVRLDAGVTGRANSVLPLGMPARGRLDDAIDEVEALYRARGLPPMFQMFGAAMPDGLDKALDARGYGLTSPSAFLVGDPRSILFPEEGNVRVVLHDHVTEDWAAVWGHDLDGRELAIRRAILDRIPAPRAFAVVRVAGAAVAVGQCAVSNGWGWFHAMQTIPAMRGQGLAGVVLGRLAIWAVDAGAGQLFIQVRQDNASALRAYENAGFRHAFDYWYRVQSRR